MDKFWCVIHNLNTNRHNKSWCAPQDVLQDSAEWNIIHDNDCLQYGLYTVHAIEDSPKQIP